MELDAAIEQRCRDTPPLPHPGEEFAYILSGELRFFIDRVDRRLGPGDPIHFDSTPVEAVWVLTPRLF